MRIYRLVEAEIGQVTYQLLKALGTTSLGMLMAGALIGGSKGLGIILIFGALPWFGLFFRHRFLRLPFAPIPVQLTVQAQSRRLGLAPPAVYQFRDTKPVASAMGGVDGSASVVVNSGLLRLPKDEVDGVIAHELAHIKKGDSLLMTGVVTAVGLVGMGVAIGLVEEWAILGVVVGVLSLVSWACELRADALGAYACGDSLALSRALQRSRSYNWPIGLPLLFVGIFGLLHSNSISLLPLLLLSHLVTMILPTHPPTVLRTWLLHRASLARRITSNES